MGGTSGAGGDPPPMDEDITLRMAGNTVANISGNVFSRAFDILTFLLLARYLGVDRFGQFSFVFAFVGIFSVFVDFGVNYILIRDISKPGGDKEALLGAGLSLKFFLSLAAVAAACLAIMVLDYPGPVRVMVAIVSLNLLISFRFPSFRDVFEVPLICGLKMKYSAAAAVMNRGLSFVAVLMAQLAEAPVPPRACDPPARIPAPLESLKANLESFRKLRQ